MLYSKFEPIPTSIFRVMAILKNEKNPCTIAHGFFQKMAPKSQKIFYCIFLYILMYLCCIASLSQFRLQFFELWSF